MSTFVIILLVIAVVWIVSQISTLKSRVDSLESKKLDSEKENESIELVSIEEESDVLDSRKYKIVHFEDEEILARMYANKFKNEGFEIKNFSNPPAEPENLIKLIQTEKPDLIIMDIIMPQVDGFTATQVLKNNPKTKDIPIIGFDNLAQQPDYDEAKKIGMDDYIVKATLTPIQFVNIIKEFLQNPKSYKPIFGEYKE